MVNFLRPISLGHSTGNTLFLEIRKSLQNEGVSVSKLLSLASDGQDVNKTVLRLMYEKFSEICGRPLVDMDTYTLHIVHNDFGAGFKAYGSQTQELALDLHALFKGSAARKEDLQVMQ